MRSQGGEVGVVKSGGKPIKELSNGKNAAPVHGQVSDAGRRSTTRRTGTAHEKGGEGRRRADPNGFLSLHIYLCLKVDRNRNNT